MTAPAYAAPPPTRPALLTKALLTARDVPEGYQPYDAGRIHRMLTSALAAYRPGTDPCAARPAQSPPVVPAGRGVTALFADERTGTVLVEALADTGEKVAAGLVADAGTVLGGCPVITTSEGRLEVGPLDWNPRLGDASITVGLRIDAGSGEPLRGRMALVAYRDLSLIVGLIGLREPGERDLKKVVRTAVRKMVLNSGISVKEHT